MNPLDLRHLPLAVDGQRRQSRSFRCRHFRSRRLINRHSSGLYRPCRNRPNQEERTRTLSTNEIAIRDRIASWKRLTVALISETRGGWAQLTEAVDSPMFPPPSALDRGHLVSRRQHSKGILHARSSLLNTSIPQHRINTSNNKKTTALSAVTIAPPARTQQQQQQQ